MKSLTLIDDLTEDNSPAPECEMVEEEKCETQYMVRYDGGVPVREEEEVCSNILRQVCRPCVSCSSVQAQQCQCR